LRAALVVRWLLIYSGALSWFGRLPGDIRYEGEHTRFYFPLGFVDSGLSCSDHPDLSAAAVLLIDQHAVSVVALQTPIPSPLSSLQSSGQGLRVPSSYDPYRVADQQVELIPLEVFVSALGPEMIQDQLTARCFRYPKKRPSSSDSEPRTNSLMKFGQLTPDDRLAVTQDFLRVLQRRSDAMRRFIDHEGRGN
jgi:hypothetical protein